MRPVYSFIPVFFLLIHSSVYPQAKADSLTLAQQRYVDTLLMGGSYLIGKEMPDFKIRSLSNQFYSKTDLKGKVTLFNFWYSECEPCIAEADILNELYEKYGRNNDFQFLSVTFEKYPQSFIDRHKMRYPVFSVSSEEILKLNFKKGYPATIITNKAGQIIYFSIGGSKDPSSAKSLFEKEIYPLLDKFLFIE